MQLFYKRYGEGPPLIILHGLLGAGGNWHTLSSNVFGEQFEVFTVDQRNHGRSPHSDVFDYDAMARDLEAFMDARGLQKAHVLGHSMGGKTAMQFALTRPQRVDRLVVVDIAPKAYPPRHKEILAALQALDLEAHESRSDVDAALAKRIESYPIRQFLLKNLDYDRETGYSWKMNLDVIEANYDRINVAIGDGRTFEGPVRFIRGGLSDYVTDADLPQIRTLFPRAELVTIERAGHWVHAEQPQAFAEAVLDFLNAR